MICKIENRDIFIKRRDEWILQWCCRNHGIHCGEWCPAFNELTPRLIQICTGQLHQIEHEEEIIEN